MVNRWTVEPNAVTGCRSGCAMAAGALATLAVIIGFWWWFA